MKNKKDIGASLLQVMFNNKVVLMIVLLCVVCLAIADTTASYVLGEVVTRFGRNTCLVLALIIPCLAGLGMNFGIVVGATAAQIAIFFVAYWGFRGIGGFLLCALMSTPLAVLFGWMLGRVYNKTKGSEMITGLVVGFLTDGLYRLFVLYIIGGIIPYNDPNLLPRGFGLRNAFDLSRSGMKYALDDVSLLVVLRIALAALALYVLVRYIFEGKHKGISKKDAAAQMAACAAGFGLTFAVPAVPGLNAMMGGSRIYIYDAITVSAVCVILYTLIVKVLIARKKGLPVNAKRAAVTVAVSALLFASTYIGPVFEVMRTVTLAPAAFAAIWLFCIINNWILDTRLGMDMRTVGQSRTVAVSAGINVNRIRIIATCISTVLAAWGQLIFLQNLGTFNTVQQQSYVGLYAVAAILVGGANVYKATNKQALLGVLLFHFLFIVAPLAATKIVGDSAISEYIRMFISYGIITIALAMHTWTKVKSSFAKAK